MEPPFSLSFEDFWRWISGHPNCILRAGTPEAVIYDDEDLHWRFAAEDEETLLVQLIRGKRLLGELSIRPDQISFVQAVPQEREDEHVFELISDAGNRPFAAYFFVMIHGYDEDTTFSPARVH